MKTIIRWISGVHGEHDGPVEIEKEFDLSVILRIGEELDLCFHPVPPCKAPDGSLGPDPRGFESVVATTVADVRWTLLETGELVLKIIVEDQMGLEADEMQGLLALGWKPGV